MKPVHSTNVVQLFQFVYYFPLSLFYIFHYGVDQLNKLGVLGHPKEISNCIMSADLEEFWMGLNLRISKLSDQDCKMSRIDFLLPKIG